MSDSRSCVPAALSRTMTALKVVPLHPPQDNQRQGGPTMKKADRKSPRSSSYFLIVRRRAEEISLYDLVLQQ